MWMILRCWHADARLTFGFDLDLPERIVRGTDAPRSASCCFAVRPRQQRPLESCLRRCCYVWTSISWAASRS